MYEEETYVPHFLYYEAKEERLTLFRYTLDQLDLSAKDLKEIERMAKIGGQQKGVTKGVEKHVKITDDIFITFIDRLVLKPKR